MHQSLQLGRRLAALLLQRLLRSLGLGADGRQVGAQRIHGAGRNAGRVLGFCGRGGQLGPDRGRRRFGLGCRLVRAGLLSGRSGPQSFDLGLVGLAQGGQLVAYLGGLLVRMIEFGAQFVGPELDFHGAGLGCDGRRLGGRERDGRRFETGLQVVRVGFGLLQA